MKVKAPLQDRANPQNRISLALRASAQAASPVKDSNVMAITIPGPLSPIALTPAIAVAQAAISKENRLKVDLPLLPNNRPIIPACPALKVRTATCFSTIGLNHSGIPQGQRSCDVKDSTSNTIGTIAVRRIARVRIEGTCSSRWPLTFPSTSFLAPVTGEVPDFRLESACPLRICFLLDEDLCRFFFAISYSNREFSDPVQLRGGQLVCRSFWKEWNRT